MEVRLNSLCFYRGDIYAVNVGVWVTAGIGIHIVGMPDYQTKETLLRVATALQSCGYKIPGKKVVIQVTPLLLKTCMIGGNGAREETKIPQECYQSLDLAIALGMLMASGQIGRDKRKRMDLVFFAKLGLDGSLLPPFCGLSDADAPAAILSWQVRRSYSAILGYPANEDSVIWEGYPTLPALIEKL